MPTGITPYRRFNTVHSTNVSNTQLLVGTNTGDVTFSDVNDNVILKEPLFQASDFPYSSITITKVEAQYHYTDVGSVLTSGNNMNFKFVNEETTFLSDPVSTLGMAIREITNINNGLPSNIYYLPHPTSTVSGTTAAAGLFTPDDIVSKLRFGFEITDDTPDFTATLKGTTTDPAPAVRAYYTYIQPSKFHVLSRFKLKVNDNSKIVIN
jgi:hypothetical protein